MHFCAGRPKGSLEIFVCLPAVVSSWRKNTPGDNKFLYLTSKNLFNKHVEFFLSILKPESYYPGYLSLLMKENHAYPSKRITRTSK